MGNNGPVVPNLRDHQLRGTTMIDGDVSVRPYPAIQNELLYSDYHACQRTLEDSNVCSARCHFFPEGVCEWCP
jgi:hypothetical protein